MNVVYYSVVLLGAPHVERQWTQSIRSLRRYNRDIEVRLFVFGTPSIEMQREADAARVDVRSSDYSWCFSEVPAYWVPALERFVAAPKILALAHMRDERNDHLCYLDCDTFFFGDVEALFDRYCDCDWYAREEPGSARSHCGYDPHHVDEVRLDELTRREHLVTVAPYNTGVMVMKRDCARALGALTDDFLWYLWRLLVGACTYRPAAVHEPWLVDYVHRNATQADRALALDYPAGNTWIGDEVATWLLLGRLPGLRHDVFDRRDVVQNGESAEHTGCLVAHYFSSGEAAFFARVASIERAGSAP